MVPSILIHVNGGSTFSFVILNIALDLHTCILVSYVTSCSGIAMFAWYQTYQKCVYGDKNRVQKQSRPNIKTHFWVLCSVMYDTLTVLPRPPTYLLFLFIILFILDPTPLHPRPITPPDKLCNPVSNNVQHCHLNFGCVTLWALESCERLLTLPVFSTSSRF